MAKNVISLKDGPCSSDSICGRVGERPAIVGSSCSDSVSKSSPICTLSRNSVSSSPLMKCSLLAVAPPKPLYSSGPKRNPFWSLLARSLSVSTGYFPKQGCASAANHLLQNCTRGSIPGVGPQELVRILSRCQAHFQCDHHPCLR